MIFEQVASCKRIVGDRREHCLLWRFGNKPKNRRNIFTMRFETESCVCKIKRQICVWRQWLVAGLTLLSLELQNGMRWNFVTRYANNVFWTHSKIRESEKKQVESREEKKSRCRCDATLEQIFRSNGIGEKRKKIYIKEKKAHYARQESSIQWKL